MVIRYAIIRNGVVENVHLWDGDLSKWQPPEGTISIPAPDDIGIGWSWEGENWIEPVIPEPPAELPSAE
jgi:hypothetical protein